ncbi:MAG: hypothetical protein RIQ92_543 [Actinomycetota bacterium]|jgi:hypothetical protein
MKSFLPQIPHGNFSIETRPIVREDRFNKFAKIPVFRTLLAIYFIMKDDAFLRPTKPDPTKPMYYRRGIWKVHNCGQRKDGTFLTSGNAAIFVYENGKEIYDSTTGDLAYSELKAKYGNSLP